MTRPRGDAGQAFPLYITAVAALLFLGLAFFAVGQAGATRNGGQTAADSAALAAAQDYRDQLRTAFLRAVLDGTAWQDILQGRFPGAMDACDQARAFAAKNDADTVGCQGPDFFPTSFTVTVETRKPVGRTVIPGTEDKRATATATAVVEPRCVLGAPATPPAPPSPTGEEGGDGGGPGGDDGQDGRPAVELRCDGEPVTIDPRHPDLFPRAKDLFTVHLAH
ncbi:pilus assembly protein TadG-related protein [Streptomyces sp. B1866]|uniref:pilus assembly protein TadG-related protein n=1 Tax=Streptomyces sp. B1866 TaxID=3075431 RepID=UPI00288F81AC|nr:pilus assembly protein TadG-related protein [Streptomyces sp. B1866]MDT3397024.1 pilus assembly protein TadG-related protein [Streptomyces sp. B1866]